MKRAFICIRHDRSRRRIRAAFTLFELMLALAIMALVAGGIFSLISAAIKATAEANIQQEYGRKEEALGEFLRSGFANLPPKCRLSLRTREVGGNRVREIFIDDAPNAFNWGRTTTHGGQIGLLLAPRADGLLDFRIARIGDTGRRNIEVEGVRLVGGFRVFDWSVLDPGLGTWRDGWFGQLPFLVRLRWQLQGDNVVSERIFDIPASRVEALPEDGGANG